VAGLNPGWSADVPVPAPRAGPLSPLARQQYAALVWLQFRIFVNGFRTLRGSFEFGARIITGFL